jgi:hypothetical protein
MLDTEPGSGSSAAAAERLETIAPGYLAKARRAAARLGVHTGADDTLDILLEDVADQARIDVEVPTASRRREGVYLKKAIKLAVRWYIRYVAGQMTAFGESMSKLGRELATRIDAVDARSEELSGAVDALTGDMKDIKARVARLESGDPVSKQADR